MYNPSRGGVRGGADQFTWESVKTDKHRENYLGHSLMAPVGRWQKGKDLSWYAKDRKDAKTQEMIDKSELASIKRAEEEAMLIALGHNIVRKTQTLTKEDMREALKRNAERDDYQIERIDGVGAASQRIASLSGVRKDSRQVNEGVAFETVRKINIRDTNDFDERRESLLAERKKSKKKSKKHKKEKKHKRHHQELPESGFSDNSSKHEMRYTKSGSDDEDTKASKIKHAKKLKHKHRDYSSDSDLSDNIDSKPSRQKTDEISKYKREDYAEPDTFYREERIPSKVKSHKKCKSRHKDYSSDSDSQMSVIPYKTTYKRSHSEDEDESPPKGKSHKKSKHKHKDYSCDDSDERSFSDAQKKDHKKHKKHKKSIKRHRHDTSDSD